MFDYAVDIGGGYTTIYMKNQGFVLKEPTMVAVEKIKNIFSVKAVGIDAQNLLWKTPETVEVFNPVTNGVIENFEYAKIMLSHFLQKVGFKKNKHKVMVLMHCGTSHEEKKLFARLFEDLGFLDFVFLPSILCTANGSGKNISSNKACLMVNMGATTTDIAAINLSAVIQGVSLGIGGKMIDIEIANALATSKRGDDFLVGLPTAEKIKNEIGSLYKNDTLNIEVLGTSLANALPSAKIVESKDIKKVIEAFFEEIIRTIEVTINTLPPEIAQDIVNAGIIFAGGLANLSGLKEFLKKNLAYNFTIVKNPEDVTILGAGKILGDKTLLDEILTNL